MVAVADAVCHRLLDRTDSARHPRAEQRHAIVWHLITCNERWGINYFAVRELDEFEPVLRALR